MRRKKDRAAGNVGKWGRLTEGYSADRYPRKSLIYTPDQPARELLLLSSGQVRLYLRSAEGRTLTLRVLEPGQLFGLVALNGDDTYDTYAQALSPAQIYQLDRAAVRQVIEHDPALGAALLNDLTQHYASVSHRLEEVAFKSVPARLASLLLDMARTQGDAHSSRLPRRSHRQLAEMINTYRETVTKVINQFRAARLLEIDRSTITLVNLPMLEELAQG